MTQTAVTLIVHKGRSMLKQSCIHEPEDVGEARRVFMSM